MERLGSDIRLKAMTANNDFTERYSRQTMLPGFGEEGQQKLLASSVLIIGAGGLGAPVATYLTGAGVGHIGIADPDTVSLSNLQRQTLYSEQDVGKPKTECAIKRLEAMSSVPSFTAHPQGITPQNAQEIIRRYDLVIDCTDNFPTRYLIDDSCAKCGKPWVHGAIGEFHGQVSVFNHRQHRRYTDLYPDRDTLCNLPRRTTGVIGAVPGVIGSILASEAIKIITGIGESLEGHLFTIDLLTMQTVILDF